MGDRLASMRAYDLTAIHGQGHRLDLGAYEYQTIRYLWLPVIRKRASRIYRGDRCPAG